MEHKKDLKIVTENDAVEQIRDIMIRQGYSEVTKTLYNKQKKKVEHGVWKIGKNYYYFLKSSHSIKMLPLTEVKGNCLR